MNGSKKSRSSTSRAIRLEIVGRLSVQRVEIERAVLKRIRLLSTPDEDASPVYVDGLRNAIAASLSFGFEAIKNDGDWSGPIPNEIGEQARRSANSGVRLDTVMRRYAAGSKALEEFILVEADGIPTRVLRQILSNLGPALDRLMASAATEYMDELRRAGRTAVQKEAEQIVDLLGSTSLTIPVDLAYDFDLWHVGIIFRGRDGEAATRAFADRSGGRSLHIVRDDETVWAWIASSERPEPARLERLLMESAPADVSLGLGAARPGLAGWRLTHREAQVALQLMLRKSRRLTRARESVLRVGVLRDDTLVRSLLDGYLLPLEQKGRTDRVLIETLRAYFSSGGNAAAAAGHLGVQRHTVQRRIRTVEERLGQFLHTCYAELYVALQIDELADSEDHRDPPPGALATRRHGI